MANQIARSSQPTVRESLSNVERLNPSIKPSGLYSYDEARPGYVERDRMAGSQLSQLARSLESFDRTLIPVWKAHLDDNIEKEVAKGEALLHDSPDELKYRSNFKDYVEAHPEMAGYNPWLQKGYEQARLKHLALMEDKAMNDEFVRSGMVNETDPAKVKQWTEDFSRNYRKNNFLDKYEDKLMLAKNYSPVEYQNKQGLYAAHSKYMAQQVQDRAMKMFNELTGTVIDKHWGNGDGTLNIGFEMDDEDAQEMAALITSNLEEYRASGGLDGRVGAMMIDQVFDIYEKAGENPSAFKLFDILETPDGTQLIHIPGVAEKIDALIERKTAKIAAAEARAHQRKAQAAKNWNDFGLNAFVVNWPDEVTPSLENLRNSKEIVGVALEDWQIPEAMKAITDWRKSNYEMRTNDLSHQPMYQSLFFNIASGIFNSEDSLNIAHTFGPEVGKKVAEEVSKFDQDQYEEYVKQATSLSKEVFSLFSKEGEDMMDQYMGELALGVKAEDNLGLRAADEAQQRLWFYANDYYGDNGRMPTSAEYLRECTRIKREIGAAYSMRPAKEWDTQNKQKVNPTQSPFTPMASHQSTSNSTPDISSKWQVQNIPSATSATPEVNTAVNWGAGNAGTSTATQAALNALELDMQNELDSNS